jgi:nucleosome binding factor SPN SPT16 subunit
MAWIIFLFFASLYTTLLPTPESPYIQQSTENLSAFEETTSDPSLSNRQSSAKNHQTSSALKGGKCGAREKRKDHTKESNTWNEEEARKNFRTASAVGQISV